MCLQSEIGEVCVCVCVFHVCRIPFGQGDLADDGQIKLSGIQKLHTQTHTYTCSLWRPDRVYFLFPLWKSLLVVLSYLYTQAQKCPHQTTKRRKSSVLTTFTKSQWKSLNNKNMKKNECVCVLCSSPFIGSLMRSRRWSRWSSTQSSKRGVLSVGFWLLPDPNQY